MLLLVLPFISACTSTYAGRYILWNFTSVHDYRRFPHRQVDNDPQKLFFFPREEEPSGKRPTLSNTIRYPYRGKEIEADLETFLKSTGTTAFIVIKDDALLYENYFNGCSRDSIQRSFSVSKSFISALVGIAIDEGHIKGVDEPFTNYIPELKGKGFDAVTIKNLLLMTSGFKFQSGFLPWNDLTILYYTPDLRKYVLSHILKVEEPGRHFLYKSYDTLLLGIILERSTQMPVSKYLEEKIWKPLGMEYPALWSMNSEKDGFESCPSGLNARAIDFAKFARLFLAEGKWEDRQIISQNWIKDSVSPLDSVANKYYPRRVEEEDLYYKYHWWGHLTDGDGFSYFASGQFGQMIYVDPGKRLIVVRFGKKSGNMDHGWQEVARRISKSLE